MAVASFPARNKLAYPAGCAPGVGLSHPASDKLILSVAAGPGNNFVNLASGAPLINQSGTQVTAPTAGVHGTIGPTITSLTGGKALGISVSGRSFNAMTMAGIFRYSAASNGGFQSIMLLDSNVGLYIDANAVNLFILANHLSTVLLANQPYFVACSTVLVSGSSIFFVVKNLNTGETFTTTTTHTSNAISGKTALCVGQDTFNEWADFPIAAAMFSNTALSMSQLLQWAADPWAFWYPPPDERLIATAAPTTQYAAFSVPQQDGGAYTRMIGY